MVPLRGVHINGMLTAWMCMVIINTLAYYNKAKIIRKSFEYRGITKILFALVIVAILQKARVFDTVSHFHPSLKFAG